MASVICMLLSIIGKAQQADTISKAKLDWKPVNLASAGNNALNGVLFYHKAGECDKNIVILLKVVNANKFPVKVQWQEDPLVTKSIIVPASTSIEGKCNAGSADSSESKLVILKSGADKVAQMKQLFLTTLIVSEVK